MMGLEFVAGLLVGLIICGIISLMLIVQIEIKLYQLEEELEDRTLRTKKELESFLEDVNRQ